jgi:hypothetical protein
MSETFTPVDQGLITDATAADTDLSGNETYIEFSKRVDACAEYIKQHPGLPILSHFTPIDNMLDMIESTSKPELGTDALRIRPINVNEALGIDVQTGYGMGYAGTVSYFLSGNHSIEVDEPNTAKSKGEGLECAKFVPSYVVLLCPLRTVVKDNIDGANYQGGGEINIHFSANGNRDELLKCGLNILDPEVQIVIHQDDKVEFRKHLGHLPAETKSLIEHKLHVVSDEESEQMHEQIINHSFDTKFNEMIAKSTGTSQEQLLEINALSSMFDIGTQDLSQDPAKRMKSAVRIWSTDPVKGLLDDFAFPYVFKEVLQRLAKRHINIPDRKVFFREVERLAKEIASSN